MGLIDLFKEEREEQKKFREDVRERLGSIELWIAGEKAVKEDRAKLRKALTWAVGTTIAIAGLILPFLLS